MSHGHARLLAFLFVLLPHGAGMAQTPAPSSAPAVGILALGEQSQRDSVPRDSRIYARVVTALNDVMSRSGVAVYDETAVTASFTSQSRTLRSDAELIEIARAVPAPPLDALLIFEIQARAERRGDRSWFTPRVVITGRILHVQTGRVFARIESGSATPLPDIPPDCVRNRVCFGDALGDQARPLAADLATTLMRQLAMFTKEPAPAGPPPVATPAPVEPPPRSADGCGPRRRATIVLNDYRPADLFRIERYLAVLRCRIGHSLSTEGPHPQVTYESGLDLRELLVEIAASAALWSPPGTAVAVDERIVVTARR